MSTYTNIGRWSLATKIRLRENFTSELFYWQKYPDLRYMGKFMQMHGQTQHTWASSNALATFQCMIKNVWSIPNINALSNVNALSNANASSALSNINALSNANVHCQHYLLQIHCQMPMHPQHFLKILTLVCGSWICPCVFEVVINLPMYLSFPMIFVINLPMYLSLRILSVLEFHTQARLLFSCQIFRRSTIVLILLV